MQFDHDCVVQGFNSVQQAILQLLTAVDSSADSLFLMLFYSLCYSTYKIIARIDCR
jgi:hypothetical protein